MLELWKMRRARKAVLAAILPLVQRTRFVHGHISDDAWLEAYMVGFLSMLITLIAQRSVSSIGSDALGNVQADTWQEITGLPGSLFGEEMCLLSASGHRDFERGCHNAAMLVTAMTARRSTEGIAFVEPCLDGAMYGSLTDQMRIDEDVWTLWSDYFERARSRVSGLRDGQGRWER